MELLDQVPGGVLGTSSHNNSSGAAARGVHLDRQPWMSHGAGVCQATRASISMRLTLTSCLLNLAVVLVATSVLAEEPLGKLVDGPAFEALAEGRTLAYQRDGEDRPYGIERHYPGGRVTWFLVDTGECLEGSWYPAGTPSAPQICFTYDDGSGPQCFRYWRDGDRLLSTDLDGSDLDTTELGAEHQLEFGCEFLGA